MEKDEIIKELTSAYEDGVFRHKEYDACKLAIKALEENDKLKAKIDILKEKNFGQSLQLAKWKDEYADLKSDIEQLKTELEQSVKLPCKVGDAVYIINTFFWENREKCSGCKYFHEGSDVFRDDDCCTYSDEFDKENNECFCISEMTATIKWILNNLKLFGKTVFLTRAEAEKALTEMESKNNE